MPARLRRFPQMMLFAAFAAWYFGSRVLGEHAAAGFSGRFAMAAGTPALAACFHLFLLLVGFAVMRAMTGHRATTPESIGMPRRPSVPREWALGTAVGWGAVVLGVLPILLSGRMHATGSWAPRDMVAVGLSLVTVAISALAAEIAFRGYPFQCLIAAMGPVAATLFMMAGAGFLAWRDPFAPRAGILAVMLVTLALAVGWFRTHGIWASWGLHFGLVASLGVVFGMTVAGAPVGASLVSGSTYGPDWLTGGDFGPGAALFSLLVLGGTVPVLYWLTRDYAWQYTFAPLVPGGYEVQVAAPAAHTAMEQQAAAAPSLVQILPTTPQSMAAGSPVAPAAVPPDRLHR